MKNFQFTSRETDSKILAALGFLGLAIAGFVAGGFIPMPSNQEVNRMPWILAAISVGLALLVWSIFRLIEPVRPDRNWKTAAVTLACLTWLVLMLGAYVSVDLMTIRTIREIQDIATPMLRA